MALTKDFKATIMARAKKYKKFQVEFAKKISVSQAELSDIENGRRPVGEVIAKRVEKVFGTSYRYFLERTIIQFVRPDPISLTFIN